MKLVIDADLRITRRKLFHVVTNEAGSIVFRSRLIGECVAFCEAEGADIIVLTCSPDEKTRAVVAFNLVRSI